MRNRENIQVKAEEINAELTAAATIYWTTLNINDWKLIIAATSSGLCFVGSEGGLWEEFGRFIHTRYPNGILVESPSELASYCRELKAYLAGQCRQFHLPLDLQGTAFQLSVWEALSRIPHGETKSYTDIALELQKPSAVRAVGSAIGANPCLIAIPCHRVIGKNGALTGYRGGLEMKKRLLELEQASLRI